MTSRPTWGNPHFESEVLRAIIHDEFGPDSKVELQGLRVRARYFTGAGLYSEFFYAENAPTTPVGAGDSPSRTPSSWRLAHIFGTIPEVRDRSALKRGLAYLLENLCGKNSSVQKQTISSDIFAIVPGADDIGFGFLLFLEGNRIETLEAFTYGGDDPWWGSIDQFSLYRAPMTGQGEPVMDRPLRAEEKAIIVTLCDAASVSTPDSETLDRILVRDVSDPAGAVRFFDVEAVPRRVGRPLAEAEYRDDDGATVRLVLWLDNEGNLFGLDMWKPNFAPLQRYPKPGDLQIRAVAGSRVVGNANLDMFDSRTIHALTAGRDRPDSRDRDGLAWLQSWYLKQCDGNWEHEYGVEIDTLDNPGWCLKVQIEGTPLEGRKVDQPQIQGLNDRDWIKVRSDGKTFEGWCGPSNLDELLNAFRRFAESDASPKHPDWVKSR